MLSDSCACVHAALINSNDKYACPSFRKQISKYIIVVVFPEDFSLLDL